MEWVNVKLGKKKKIDLPLGQNDRYIKTFFQAKVSSF